MIDPKFRPLILSVAAEMLRDPNAECELKDSGTSLLIKTVESSLRLTVLHPSAATPTRPTSGR